MSQRYTNQTNIALPLAVFLATDDYDYERGVISATSLLKPVRQIVLAKRVNPEDTLIDISQLIASRMGSALHTAIEHVWKTNAPQALEALGYSKHVQNNIFINPTPEDLQQYKDAIPVYMEQRAYKELDGFKVSGKFDFVAEGKVHDFKSTSAYTYLYQTNTEKYILQGSIYRWLNQDIITQDTMNIHFIFTDWSSAEAKRNPNYPQQRLLTQNLKLLSIEETEKYIKDKLAQIKRYKDVDESKIPLCTDEELWRSETVYKYYKDPNKTQRATKNFDTDHTSAFAHLAEQGGVGVVIEVKGQVKACNYCPAFSVCTQKDALIASGDLILN